MRTYKSEKLINYTDCMIQQQTRENKTKKLVKQPTKKSLTGTKKQQKSIGYIILKIILNSIS